MTARIKHQGQSPPGRAGESSSTPASPRSAQTGPHLTVNRRIIDLGPPREDDYSVHNPNVHRRFLAIPIA